MNAKRERGTGRLFQRGDIWWCQYYFHGEQIRVSTGETDEKKAGKFLRTKIGQVEAGVHTDSRNLRYKDLREAYMDYFQTEKKKSLRFKDGKACLDTVARLDDFFSGYRAIEIDAPLIRKFIAEQQAKGLADGTINRSTSALRRMFYLAQEDGKLTHVPTFPILSEKSAIRKGFIERPQYDALRAALPDYLRLPLALGYFTGMRLSEVLNLRWEQVDFLSGTITLYAGETKSDEGRVIPIPVPLAAALMEQRAKRPADFPLVCFRFERSGHAVKLEGFRKAWQSACIRAGLGKMEPMINSSGEPVLAKPRGDRKNAKAKPRMIFRGTLYHDLRRSFVRNAIRSGVPEKIAMGISGHETREIFDRYAGMNSGADLKQAAASLSAFHKDGDKTGTMLHQDAADDLPVY